METPRISKVLVVGGGFAGISAATALAEKGHTVELLESRSSLGGRVYSIPHSEHFPAPVDNGPHLLMGCYTETRKLLNRLDEKKPFLWVDPLKLTWFDRDGRVLTLKGFGFAPFHLAFGFFFTNAFPRNEKGAMFKALMFFARKPFSLPRNSETLDKFLAATGQGPKARERFWTPLCNAVMNVPPAQAPTLGLGEVLHRIFFQDFGVGSSLAFPARPLSEMGFPKVGAYLKKQGGMVLTGEGIQSFTADGRGFSLTSRSGKSFTADTLIWAIPPSNLSALWPAGTWERTEEWKRLGKSPIVSIHVILSGKVTEEPMFGLPGAHFEWVFNRNSDWGWKGEGDSQYLSFTASAAEGLGTMKDHELLELAMKELRERCPAAKDLQVLHSKATREMAATFRWTVETGPLRPPCETPYPNIFLAGDWTDTGLPATIEGACLSGHRAAQKTVEYLKTR